ncbi:MAG: TIGR04255 family protein [Bacteroidales bacterium]|nr:TIGR04255 family protein [Bacteroidales bacterium]
MEKIDRTLKNNKIKEFILRLDFDMAQDFPGSDLVNWLKGRFQLTRTEQQRHYRINDDKMEVKVEDFNRYVFVANNVTIRVDFLEKAFTLTSQGYINNTIYKPLMAEIIEFLLSIKPETRLRRIGLRYINEFPEIKSSNLGKLLSTNSSSFKKAFDKETHLSRIVMVEEYQDEEFRHRVQYGFMNRFYPSRLTRYDFVLDIDVYSEGRQPLADCEATISKLNHSAHDTFILFIKEDFRNSMK